MYSTKIYKIKERKPLPGDKFGNAKSVHVA